MTRQQEAAVVAALRDIAERAEHECEAAKRRGEKQGNYRNISSRANAALRYWTYAEIVDLETV